MNFLKRIFDHEYKELERFKKIADILDITYGQSFNLLNENKIESTN